MLRPTYIHIDLDALVANAHAIKGLTKSSLIAVVKADAYGHGALPCAKALRGVADYFAVSLVEEGVALRDGGISEEILVMGPTFGQGYEEVVRSSLTPMLSRHEDIAKFANNGGKRAHLLVDTGMERLGIHPADVTNALTKANESGIDVCGIATHFADADIDPPSDLQCRTYEQLTHFSRVPFEGFRHAANSAAALRFEGTAFDAVRVGIALYGNFAHQGLRPVMSLRSQIAQIRVVAAGARVSYGGTWTASRTSKVAVIPIGYADGVPRSMSGRGEVLVGGKRVPIIGTVTMDMILCDVSDVSAQVGDDVVVLGKQGDSEITVADWVQWTGLSPYEVTCGMSKRLPREY